MTEISSELHAEHLHLEVVDKLGESKFVADIHVHRPNPLPFTSNKQGQVIGTICDKTRIQIWSLSKSEDQVGNTHDNQTVNADDNQINGTDDKQTNNRNAVAVSWMRPLVKDDKVPAEQVKARLAAMKSEGDINSLMKEEEHVHIHLSARGFKASSVGLEFKEDEHGNFVYVGPPYGPRVFEGFSATLSRGTGKNACDSKGLAELPCECQFARFKPNLERSQRYGKLMAPFAGWLGMVASYYTCVLYKVTNVEFYDGAEGRKQLDKSGW